MDRARRACALAVLGLLLATSGCNVVDTKYYDRLVRNGSGGGRDDDAGEDPDAHVDAAVSSE
jgi:hypothetical protein